MAKQARLASRRGACVLPVTRTGGASSGLFQFPRKALEKPDFAEQGHWDALSAEVPIATTAEAVVAMVEAVCQLPGGCGRSLQEQPDSDPELDDLVSPMSPEAWLRELLFPPAWHMALALAA